MTTFIATTITLILIIMGGYFVHLLYYPKAFTLDKSYELEVTKNPDDVAYYERLKKEDVYLASPHGYKLYAKYIPNGDSKKTIIFSHGYSYNHHGSIKYLKTFYDMGYNALLVDHRFHGRSQGNNTTFGYYEKDDLSAWSDWLFDNTLTESELGIHGESMGASMALTFAAHDTRINFVIADCPFGDMMSLLKHRLYSDYKLPHFPIIMVASLLSYIHCGFLFRSLSPEKLLDRIKVPILFIHGVEDRYILPHHSESLFQKTTSKKSLHLMPGARHAEAIRVDPCKYNEIVSSFLNSN